MNIWILKKNAGCAPSEGVNGTVDRAVLAVASQARGEALLYRLCGGGGGEAKKQRGGQTATYYIQQFFHFRPGKMLVAAGKAFPHPQPSPPAGAGGAYFGYAFG